VALRTAADQRIARGMGPHTAPWRGIVEGYYGQPWPAAARRDVIEFLAGRGMNAFVYGPKHDPWHRARWREPYPQRELEELASTAAHARTLGVRFVWAISPAIDMRWDDPGEELALHAKLEQLVAAGITDLALFFDDLPEILAAAGPGQESALAELGWRHGRLAGRVDAWLRARGSAGIACVVPAEYTGCQSSPYLDALSSALRPDMPLGWTGPAVVASTIDAQAARERRAATAGHPIALWDNYPVNDVVLCNTLHLGPLTGRDPTLPAETAWYLLNPMRQPYASLIALATAADYLRDPAGYDPGRSWERALAELDPGGGLALLAQQLRSSALTAPEYLDAHELAALSERVAASWSGPDWASALEALALELRRQAAVPAMIAASLGASPLAAEIAPWVHELADHIRTSLDAVRLLQALRPRFVELVRDSGTIRGRVLAPDLDLAARLGPRFAEPPRAPDLASYVSALGDLLGPDPTLPTALGLNVHGKRFYAFPRSTTALEVVRDRNVHDRFLAFVAEVWRRRDPAPLPLRLEVDTRQQPLDAHGRFAVRCRRGPVHLLAQTAGGASTAVVIP